MIMKTTVNHFSTLKLHIYRFTNILEEPESKVRNYESWGVSPNEWIRTVLHNITWKASYEATQASTDNGMHNLGALW